MFLDIAVPAVLRVRPVPEETRIGHVFLVQRPRDVLGLEEVYDGRHVGADALVPVITYPMGRATDGGGIVWLFMPMSDGFAPGQPLVCM